jgi:protein-S-isoprenylcysteine O-methyltransferase Ste14
VKRRLKINGIIIVCAIILSITFPNIFFRNKKPYSFVFNQIAETFGIAFILLGQIFRVSGRGIKSEYSKNGKLLIKDGPYSLVRNPMYLGILFIGLGIVAILFKWWVAVIFLIIFISRYVSLIFKEEKKLKFMFPQDYSEYQKRVPRILPSVKALFKKDISEYLPFKLFWLKKEIGPILGLLSVVLIIEAWEDIRKYGIALYFREAIVYLIVILLSIFLVIYLNKRTKLKNASI